MPQPTAFDTILVQSRDLFRDRLCEAVTLMFDGADASLTERADKSTNEDLKKLLLDARDLATANREVIESHFRQRLMGEFQKRTNKAKKIGESLSDFSLDDLQLVGEDDLNETLKFNDMAAKLRRYCEAELSALDQRVGVLLGDASLEADDNPFGPQVITDAYKQACRQVETSLEMRTVFIRLFDDHVLDTIRSSYKEVNDLLVENSILPKIRYAVSKQEGGKAPAAPTLEKEKEKPAEAAPAPVSEQDIFSRLSKMMGPGAGAGPGGGGGPPAPGMGVGGVPLVQGPQLMSSLTQLQVGDLSALGEAAAELGPILAEAGNLKNVLHQLKTTSVGGSMGQVDAMTLDIVAMLFDQLFDDPKIPIALKGLIGRLQLPMLKVAIADKELFTKKTHPARQLLDVLGQIGLRLPPDFDSTSPLFARLEKFVQELVDGFQEKMEIFDKVRAELESIIAEDDKRVATEMQASEKQLQQAESLAMAKAEAQEEIRARVTVAPKVPRPLIQFLAQQWIKYLTIAHARDGKESAAWKGGLETVDKLLWSVAPKPTMEERRKLASSVPALLKGVKTGVAAAGIEEAAASAFLAELMKLHTEVMHAPATPPPAAPAPAAKPATSSHVTKPTAAAAAKSATTSHLTKPTAASPAEELDFTAPITVNNPFGEGKVDVSVEDLDFTAAPPAPAQAPAPAAPQATTPVAGAPAKAAKAATGPTPQQAAAPYLAKLKTTVRLPSAMVAGAWVEIVDPDENRMPAKLHYVSPMKSHFLFVDRKGKKVFECSRSMLARRIKLGEVSLLDGEPDASLFDRIMEGIFGKLGAKVPA